MNPSDTPLTTAFWNHWEPQCSCSTVLADLLFEHGCDLERKLAGARADAGRLADAVWTAMSCNEQSREERAECGEALLAHEAISE